MLRKLVNLRPVQQQVITLLDSQVQKCYLMGIYGAKCGLEPTWLSLSLEPIQAYLQFREYSD